MSSIICALDLSTLEFSDLTGALIVLFIGWQVIQKLKEMKKSAKESIQREEGWDYAAKVVREKEKVWDDGVIISSKARQEITNNFNDKLKAQDVKIDKINEMLTKVVKALNAMLECEVENGANSDVKKMHTELNNYIAEQIGK